MPKERIVTTINDYNLALEKAQNEMLLLNIVRASKRHPMYFTGFNLMRGSMTYNMSSGSITIPFGKIGTGLNGAYSVAPVVSFSNSPSFDVGVLDTKEFTRGIMTPVSIETVDYYWQEGWPKEMLLFLFVDKVETDGGKKILTNYPGQTDEFREFETWVKNTSSCTISAKEKPAFGPPIKIDEIDVSKILDVQKAGYLLEKIDAGGEGNTYQLKPQKKDYYFECKDTNKTYSIFKLQSADTSSSADKVYLRSPEAIIYYLGEVLRAKIDKGYDTKINVCRNQPKVPLFDGGKSQNIMIDSLLSVEYEGSKYFIRSDDSANDGCKVARSMHTLALISQLISLQKSGENLPTTGVVNVLGR